MSSKGFVPESFARKQERDTKEATELTKRRAERRTHIKARREEWRNKAQKYHQAHQQAQASLVEEKRKARNNGNFYVAPEAKVAFIVRTKGINRINPTVKKILQLFRLRQLNNGVFIRINKATLSMLKRVEPYVTFGYPSRQVISELIYKRGYVKVNRARIPITDNTIIEQNLGKFGITCVEDLIEEISGCREHFKEANNFLWPFKLNNPRGGWNNKNHPFQKDGDWGNREENVNQLIRAML
jgi:large subunit ribosomal protein L7e